MNTLEYLALSKLVYQDLGRYISKSGAPISIGDLISHNDRPIKDYLNDKGDINAEYHALSGISNWTLIAQSPPTRTISGHNGTTITIENDFSCIALQNPETKEIVFAFRGTDGAGDWDTDGLIGSGIFPADWIDQFAAAREFVFQALNKHGPVCYSDEEAMFKSLGQDSNVSFTGYSLGGGLAQYLTYRTAGLSDGDTGVKSVTFNAVGVGSNVGASIEDASKYNSTDHVNSLDWVGNYGLQLGKTVTHIDNSEVDYDKVNFNSLGKMLSVRLRLSRGDITVLEYKQEIENIKESISDGSDGYTVDDTMAVYRGYENVGGKGGGGLFNFSLHGLDRFLTDNPDEPGTQYELTNTVSDQRLSTKSPRKKIVCPNVKKCSLMPAL